MLSRNPYGLADSTPATYTWRALDRDRDGVADSTPATYTWRALDRDRDGVDNCPGAANANQADGDRDQVGDACEVLPSGTLKPRAGKRATVRLLSGEVFVQLPSGASSAALRHTTRRLADDGLPPGFVPLKGNASLPVGSIVDARRGSLAVTAAAEFGGSSTQQASGEAGILQIRQQRARRTKHQRRRRATTDFRLRTPVGAARACTAVLEHPGRSSGRSMAAAPPRASSARSAARASRR